VLNHAAGAGRRPLVERGADLYETPPLATEALLTVEKLPHCLWEPAAGRGAIVQIMRDRGHAVIASDITDYGFALDFVADFLMARRCRPTAGQFSLTRPTKSPTNSPGTRSIWRRASICCFGSHSWNPNAAPTSSSIAVCARCTFSESACQ
jgi:hypothetical protein